MYIQVHIELHSLLPLQLIPQTINQLSHLLHPNPLLLSQLSLLLFLGSLLLLPQQLPLTVCHFVFLTSVSGELGSSHTTTKTFLTLFFTSSSRPKLGTFNGAIGEMLLQSDVEELRVLAYTGCGVAYFAVFCLFWSLFMEEKFCALSFVIFLSCSRFSIRALGNC